MKPCHHAKLGPVDTELFRASLRQIISEELLLTLEVAEVMNARPQIYIELMIDICCCQKS